MRKSKSGKSGFTPENLTAGLDLNIYEESQNIDEIKPKIEKEKLPREVTQTNTQSISLDPDKESDVVNQSENTDLESILGKKKKPSKNVQVNVYIYDDEIRDKLYSMGKFVGKQNGGKSFIVESALKEYFEKNQHYVEEAMKNYPPKE